MGPIEPDGIAGVIDGVSSGVWFAEGGFDPDWRPPGGRGAGPKFGEGMLKYPVPLLLRFEGAPFMPFPKLELRMRGDSGSIFAFSYQTPGAALPPSKWRREPPPEL
jgi:hypothetical protein